MRYSIEPKDRIYVKGYGFLSLAKNISTDATKVAKVMSNKYSQKRISKSSQNDEANNEIEIPNERYISP